MRIVLQSAAIGVAGMGGALLRYAVLGLVGLILPRGFPFGTLLVNVTGCFLLAVIVTLLRDRATNDTLRLALALGFVASYTTFSTLVYELQEMLRFQQTARAAAYLVASMAIGLAALQLGAMTARWIEAR